MRVLSALILLLACSLLSAQVKIKVGSLSLSTSDLTQETCLQIPVMINDPDMDGREILTLQFALAFSGDLAMIQGGIDTEILVCRGFQVSPGAGITSPGTDLDNVTAEPTPTCSLIINSATQGGDEIPWLSGPLDSAWFLNNMKFVGMELYKTGFTFDFFGGTIGTLSQNTDHMIAVLEIPIVANPGSGTITVTAPEDEDRNFYNGIGFDVTESTGTIQVCGLDITTNPDDVSACAGDMVSFTAAGLGGGPLTYQWFRNGIMLPGATAATLSFTVVDGDDAGDYTCVINDNGCELTTLPGTLTFNDFAVEVIPNIKPLGVGAVTAASALDCGVPDFLFEWTDSQGTVVSNEQDLNLFPPPTGAETYTLTATDDLLRMDMDQLQLIFHPDAVDVNLDGENDLSDLWEVCPFWRSDMFDFNGDGILDVLDMVFINVGL